MDIATYKTQKPFAQKHLLSLGDYTPDEIMHVLNVCHTLKAKQKAGIAHHVLAGKTLGMIFAKSSTRTRVAFEVGMYQLGGHALHLSTNDIQLGRGETVADTAKVLSRMVDGIMIRTFKQSDVAELAAEGSIPIINALTDLLHPTQALADIMTLYESRGSIDGAKLAFVGDGNNVAHSLMNICTKLGIDVSIATPAGFEPEADIAQKCMGYAAQSGAKLVVTHDPFEAVEGADAVYTDVWASMGQESQFEEKSKHFLAYQVNEKLMSAAKKSAIFLHCLPAHRGEEVTADVIDGAHSRVFDEAENRLHAHKAVMAVLMGGM